MGLNLMELPDELLEMIYINSCLLEIKDWKAAKSEVSSINSTTEDLHSDLELKESDALKYFSLDSIINLCLIQSCMCNNYANCATIIQYGGNVNVDNGEPICMASKYGWTDVIGLHDIVSIYVYPSSRNGHYDSVKALLLAGANVDGENNGLPLCSAAELGYSSIVSILLEFGAKHDFLQDYAIRWASLSNHLACVEILCKYGANVNSMNNYALRNCVKLKLYDMVETLLINGADPLANSSECIKFAISTADDRMIKLLIGDYKSQNKRAVIEFEE
ncbi:hypothetical protein HK099_008645 [Clydaea vesicula]|uniref:Ankyrin repeat protein n=1 Tax=Clydaea vesicula TaxID=447962 RepID=A0AAD5TVX0_9FUNG|nr:hypothetical protein HK099_008645 [Clydaea vesicula]